MGWGSSGFHEVGTVVSFTGRAPFTVTRMMSKIVVVEPFVTLVAEVRSAEESRQGIATVVMVVFLDETDDLVGGDGSCVDDHMRWIDGHDFDLVPGQGGLKLVEFVETAGSFGNASQSVKFFGQSFLDGVALFEILVISVLGISVGVYQSLHGDDGTCTTQIVFVLDGDAGFFDDPSNGSATRFVSLSVSTTGSRGTYEGGLHGKGIVGGEFLVGVQSGRESLEISVQSLTAFFEFTYREGSGLEGVSKGIGLHGEVDSGMGSQGTISCNLLLNRALKGMGEFLP